MFSRVCFLSIIHQNFNQYEKKNYCQRHSQARETHRPVLRLQNYEKNPTYANYFVIYTLFYENPCVIPKNVVIFAAD